MTRFTRNLKRLDACPDAIDWVGEMGFEQAWDKCHRADWMLWYAAHRIGEPEGPTHQTIVLAACACAEITLRQPKGDGVLQSAIASARAWARGEATPEVAQIAAWEVKLAADASDSAWATSITKDAATTTSGSLRAIARAVGTVQDPSKAAGAARSAAWAKGYDAQLKMCYLIRREIPWTEEQRRVNAEIERARLEEEEEAKKQEKKEKRKKAKGAKAEATT